VMHQKDFPMGALAGCLAHRICPFARGTDD
jgi:hypothetical protein